MEDSELLSENKKAEQGGAPNARTPGRFGALDISTRMKAMVLFSSVSIVIFLFGAGCMHNQVADSSSDFQLAAYVATLRVGMTASEASCGLERRAIPYSTVSSVLSRQQHYCFFDGARVTLQYDENGLLASWNATEGRKQ